MSPQMSSCWHYSTCLRTLKIRTVQAGKVREKAFQFNVVHGLARHEGSVLLLPEFYNLDDASKRVPSAGLFKEAM